MKFGMLVIGLGENHRSIDGLAQTKNVFFFGHPSTARVVTKTPRRAHITPLLQQLGWRSVETSVKQRHAMLVHLILHLSLAPVDLRSQFVRRVDVSQRRT